ncbi:MAG: ribonuclease J [Acidobacteria bacterium]|nr:ribonuclease J [Acidobacteriota bacterium]
MLKISFFGGLGEFGRNMTVYESGDFCLIVDCGMMFPEADTFGVDRVIPDFQSIIEKKDSKNFALLLTHAHEDHIGAVPFLLKQLDFPVYASPFSFGLLEKKIEEMELDFPQFIDITKSENMAFGPFGIEPIFVTHSIPESYTVAIRCEDGVFLHTSDFKFDQTPLDSEITDYSKLQKIGSGGVTAILIDSTNAETLGIAGSEKSVFKNLEKYISSFNNRLIITLFSTNIQRIQGILNLAEKYQKKVAFLGRSLIGNIEVAENLGHLIYPANVVINSNDIEKMDEGEVVIIATGSQGEPFSARHPSPHTERKLKGLPLNSFRLPLSFSLRS